jgi:hypothetical protein
MATNYVAVDPTTGLHIRRATDDESAAYLAQPNASVFRRPVRVGDVLVDEDHGPGAWHGGAGFLLNLPLVDRRCVLRLRQEWHARQFHLDARIADPNGTR